MQMAYMLLLPFNLNVIESTVQEAGKVLTYVKGLYDGYLAGGINVQKFKETLALDDMDLYCKTICLRQSER